MSEPSVSFEEMQRMQQQKAEYEEQRRSILDQILEPAAKERLSRLSIVKKDKARAVEDSLIAGATNGRLKAKLTEEQLIVMLEQISGGGGEADDTATKKKKGVVIQRRKYGIDDDEDEEDDSDLL